MWIRAERGCFAHEGHYFRESGSTVGVCIIPPAGGIHDVTPSPKIVKGIVHDHRAGTMLVGHFDAGVHCPACYGLPKLFVSVPSLACVEALLQNFDSGLWFASACF